MAYLGVINFKRLVTLYLLQFLIKFYSGQSVSCTISILFKTVCFFFCP